MNRRLRLLILGAAPVVVTAGCVACWFNGQGWIAALILVGLLPLLPVWRKSHARCPVDEPPASKPAARHSRAAVSPYPTPEVPAPVYDENDPSSLAQRMLDQGRYALLLRPQIAANLKKSQRRAAAQALDDAMGIVPEGDVLLQACRHANDRDEADAQRERLVHVEAMYLDRYPVTNRQFQQFVDDGGYEHMPLWDPTIWPAVLDFVDKTGHPGPRHWRDRHYPEGLQDHPVVGISWYEGAAYARWAGKRLPSDPEWVKAGCWPVLTQGTRPLQRRYPWGDT
ncbi:MAG: SUMF1/EgtB/PvdO family nonheme iron enzyme, partial [Pirellulaceae bacterium]